MKKQISVLIVDDSAVTRQVVSRILEEDPAIRVMGAVSDPLFAMQHMEKEWPDVIVLDIEMPRMDGITFLKKIMAEHPTPVIICSTLTEHGAATTLQALSSGAVAILTKPKLGLKSFLEESSIEFIDAVKTAALANVQHLRKLAEDTRNTRESIPRGSIITRSASAMLKTSETIVVIGTSTGGTQALELILTQLPRTVPGIAIVQHMPEKFTALFANRLNGLCAIDVREAAHGDRILPGLALIAPGNQHLRIRRSGAEYWSEVIDGPLVNRHRPSVDVLFRSAAHHAGANALGIIMTGMGSDGALGLKEMREAGADTIAQDEASCVVFGMPKEAIRIGAAARVLPLNGIIGSIQTLG
ncbi:MAG: protein-glutamate methylesterase/protein-glutamine glutaminase [Methylococcaceae bacterium]